MTPKFGEEDLQEAVNEIRRSSLDSLTESQAESVISGVEDTLRDALLIPRDDGPTIPMTFETGLPIDLETGLNPPVTYPGFYGDIFFSNNSYHIGSPDSNAKGNIIGSGKCDILRLLLANVGERVTFDQVRKITGSTNPYGLLTATMRQLKRSSSFSLRRVRRGDEGYYILEQKVS